MITSHPIIIADPNKTTSAMLAQLLASCEGVSIMCANTLEEISPLLNEHKNACLILSDSLGIAALTQACQNLREQGFRGQTLLIYTRDANHNFDQAETTDQFILYDHALQTPFRINQLIVLVRDMIAQINNAASITQPEIALGAFVLRTHTRTLITPNTNTVRLTEKECAIIQFLYHNSPNVVSRHDLLSQVWGYNTNVTTHTLETHIYRLRQKLETDPMGALLLLTDGGGYRLNMQS